MTAIPPRLDVAPAIRELENEKARIESALVVLYSLNHHRAHKPHRKMSDATKHKMSLAQRKRWKKRRTKQ